MPSPTIRQSFEDFDIPVAPPLGLESTVCEMLQTVLDNYCLQDIPLPPPPMIVTGERLATAVYAYQSDPESEDTISIKEGETLVVVEDDPNGWTKVRRREDDGEGFVPTSYLEFI